MNREIKFRAWDKSEGQMFLSPPDIRHLGSWFDAHLPGSLSVPENIVIMQFTGLKDRSGVEIYDGDIARYQIGDKSSCRTGKVIFSDGCNCILWMDSSWIGIENLLYDFATASEIIGNIHQNPELLP